MLYDLFLFFLIFYKYMWEILLVFKINNNNNKINNSNNKINNNNNKINNHNNYKKKI